MLTVVKSLASLIDDTLQEVAQYNERGYRVQLDGGGLASAGDTDCSLVDAARVQISDVIEFGDELVLVTAKTTDPVPVLTVARGYDGTTAAAVAGATVGTVNPGFARRRVGQVVQRSLTWMDHGRVFVTKNAVMTRTAGYEYLEMPDATRSVLRVGYFNTSTRRFDRSVDGWEYFDDIPTASVTSGKIVKLPRYIGDSDSLVVTYRIPYRWSSFPAVPTGTATIELPEGAEDLPLLYASARLCSRREMSRADLDRSEEWSKSQSVVQGVTSGLVRQMWQEAYRSLEEARSLNLLDIPRPYRRLRRYL